MKVRRRMSNKNTLKLFEKINKAWAPPPQLSVSQWADKYRILSREDSAEPGKWMTDRAPYQREVMDAVTDPEVEKVIMMWSAQLGKTAIELNIAGYYIHQDPSAIMVVVPNKDPIAKDWSKDRLAPMIRDTPELAERVADPKARDGDNSTLHKKFPGGLIVVVGANSPSDLASRPMRILLCDEIDRFPISAGTEGDPIALAEKRSITYWNRKKIYVSTPTVQGASRIEDEYNKGTKEKYCLKCPDCGDYVYLDYYGMRYKHKWVAPTVVEVGEITFTCPNCGCFSTEQTWKRQPGEWIAEAPQIRGTRSFNLNAFYSPFYTWEAIIKEKLEAKKDPEKLKVVENTLFGLPYKEKLTNEDEDYFVNRREVYDADLPAGVLLLTCGVDTQDDRLEYEITGWGKDDESWGIEYGIVVGKPDDESTWQLLDDRLNKIFKFESGLGLKVWCTFVDSGGHYTTKVYEYCKKNEQRRIFAVKGRGGNGIPIIDKLTRNTKGKNLLVLLGVDDGKTTIMSALQVKEKGPRYCHFPNNENRGYNKNYFHCLLSERQELEVVKGVKRYVWKKISSGGRNEALDTRNYALAAKEMLKPNYDELEKRFSDILIDDKKLSKPNHVVQKRRGVVKRSSEY